MTCFAEPILEALLFLSFYHDRIEIYIDGHDAFVISPGVISFASDVLYTNYTFNLYRVSHPEPVRKFLFYLTMGILI